MGAKKSTQGVRASGNAAVIPAAPGVGRRGGAGNQGGVGHQNRADAYIAARLLAEQDVQPLAELPSGHVLAFLRRETDSPVDDFMAGTSVGGLLFFQAKRRLNLSADENSELASAVAQFTRQALAYQDAAAAPASVPAPMSWERPLDPDIDRLVLAVNSVSSDNIKRVLPVVLGRLRRLIPGQPLDQAATSDEERETLRVVANHVSAAWKAARVGAPAPSDDEIASVLRLVYVLVLDLDPGQAHEVVAKDTLRSAVLERPEDADAAWSALLEEIGAAAALGRTGATRQSLLTLLASRGIAVRTARGYRADVECLRAATSAALDELEGASILRAEQVLGVGVPAAGGGGAVRIDRAVVTDLTGLLLGDMADRSDATDFVAVTGDPGAGKSGALSLTARSLRDDHGRDVVVLLAGTPGFASRAALRAELGIEHDLPEILANWPGSKDGYLFVDALDAARSPDALTTLLALLKQIPPERPGGGRWRVVASVRLFDLRYGDDIRRQFRGKPMGGTVASAPGLAGVRHLLIGDLTDAELEDVGRKAPPLGRLLAGAPPALRALLRNPFNLSLAADLLADGADLDDPTPPRTQEQLLDQYWRSRVLGGGARNGGDAREVVLRRVTEAMLRGLGLWAAREQALGGDAGSGEPLGQLLGAQVLREWQQDPGSLPRRETLAFGHHILFDYAVARLLLRADVDRLAARLRENHDFALTLRPSLAFHFNHVWNVDDTRGEFWDTFAQLNRDENGVPEVARMAVAWAAYSCAEVESDLEPLFARAEREEPGSEGFADAVGALRRVGNLLVAVTIAGSLPRARAELWWAALARLARRGDWPAAADALLACLSRTAILTASSPKGRASLSAMARHSLGDATRTLVRASWAGGDHRASLAPGLIEAALLTRDTNPADTDDVLAPLLAADRLRQRGFVELLPTALNLAAVVEDNPEFTSGLFVAAFAGADGGDEMVDHPGAVMRLRSRRGDNYNAALSQLADHFPAFLRIHPVWAIRTLQRVLEVEAPLRRRRTGYPVEEADEPMPEAGFEFAGRPAILRVDMSFAWDRQGLAHEPLPSMLAAFEVYLRSVPSWGEGEHGAALLDVLAAEARDAVVWRRVLRSAAGAPDTLGMGARSLLWTVPMLLEVDTRGDAMHLLRTLYARLDETERGLVEDAILSLPNAAPPGAVATAETWRSRFLAVLPSDLLVHPDARRARPENTPFVDEGDETLGGNPAAAVDRAAEPADVAGSPSAPGAEPEHQDLGTEPARNPAAGAATPAQPARPFVRRTDKKIWGAIERDYYDYLMGGNPAAEGRLVAIVDEPIGYAASVREIVASLRYEIVRGPADRPDATADDRRRRAIRLFSRAAEGTFGALDERYVALTTGGSSDKKTRAEADTLAETTRSIGMNVYFASGVFERSVHHRMTAAQQCRFVRELRPVLVQIAGAGDPQVAYRMLDVVDALFDCDPTFLFVLLERLIQAASERGGFQYDSMAASRVTRLLGRLLSDHRHRLLEDGACAAALVRVLNTFVAAGWSDAILMTQALELA